MTTEYGCNKRCYHKPRVRAIRKTCDNVIIGLKTTVLPFNVNELEGVAGYAEENGLFTIISPCIITGNRHANIELKEHLNFNATDIQKIILFYKNPRFMWSCHRDVLLRFFEKGEVAKPCSAELNYFLIRSTGDMYPYPLIVETLGNFPETPIEKLIRQMFQKQAGRSPRFPGNVPSSCQIYCFHQ